MLSINKLSELTGQDRRRIKRIAGVLKPTIEGRAHLYESTALIPLLYDAPGYDQKLDLSQERAQLAHFQARKAEVELKAMLGEFVAFDEAVSEVSACFVNVKAKLLALPSKAAPQVVGLDSHTEVFGVLQAFVYEALEELASMYEEKPDGKRNKRANGSTKRGRISGDSPR